MGLTKEYLRYVPAGNFNIVASANCNATFVTLEGQEGRYVAVGACEHIIIWDMRLGERAQVLSGEKSPSTCLCSSPNKRNLASGYSDGTVQIYDLKTAEVVTIFSGHTSEITCLVYDHFGHKLASGANDNDIVIWDTVAEVGLCRLIGHRGPITQLTFLTEQSTIVSSSKDTFVKFWDLDTQHCFKTLIGHRTEVWSLCLMKDNKYLLTGCGDAEIRVWKITEKDNKSGETTKALELPVSDDLEDANANVQCMKMGSLLREGKGRIVSMISDATGQVLGCHGTDKQLELFYFCTDSESQTRYKKRIKREEKKRTGDDVERGVDDSNRLCLKDEVRRLKSIKLTNKPKSLDIVLGNGGEARVIVVTANNLVELYTLQVDVRNTEPHCLRTISMQGHRSEIRALSFSSDNLAIASGSGEAVKMWNRSSQVSLRTVETGYALSIVFVPGDRHVLVGSKDGNLLVVDIAAGDVIETIPAHSGELWSICLQPDMRGVVTGGGDKTIKFWQFELVADETTESKAKMLSLLHTKTLKLEDSVLCVKISPNGKFIAAALLDSTVKIFFVDTFKFYLSLYGHKLPVLCMDITSDSTLIATGSADRNIKIWGMDFGDCHKSIFGHDDSITALQFVPKTHYFFTCGKDGKVKQWDGDSYNKIITLQGHVGEAWNLAVSPNGQFVVSSGADKVLRLYERSEQVVVLQDEQETEREESEGLATGDQSAVPGQPGLTFASKKTIGAEKSAESILECLEISSAYKILLEEHSQSQAASSQPITQPAVPLLMQAYNATSVHDFLLETFKRIRASDLEEALLLLPFTSVYEVLQYLPDLVARGDQIELLNKVMIFLIKIHHAPIIANAALLSTLKTLQKLSTVKAEEMRDTIGYNLYGMQYLQREIETSEEVKLFQETIREKRKGDKRRRQRERIKRSILSMSST